MRKLLRRLLVFILKFCVAFLAVSFLSVLVFRWVPVPVTPLMLLKCVEQKSNGKPVKLSKEWVSLDRISNHLQLAVVCSEDQNYLEHHGFDFGAIEKAVSFNKKSRHIRGASTISQQTAKNVFLWPGRSWVRKGLEVYFTFLIELCWNKHRIMEVYLNVIEMGDGIYGAEQASETYFHKSPDRLQVSEAALLAATLPNPIQLSAAHPSSYLISRQQWVQQQMELWGGTLNY